MLTIESIRGFYPHFSLGSEPGAVPCQITIVEANGRRYLKTPFAFLDCQDGFTLKGFFESALGRGYYTSAAECNAYLESEYPHWKLALPIMDKLCEAHFRSAIVGASRVADKCGVGTDQIFKLARGHKSFKRAAVRAAVKALSPNSDPQPNQMAY